MELPKFLQAAKDGNLNEIRKLHIEGADLN